MFESIVVRRTTSIGSPNPLDLGRLAEAMLFYRTVRLILTRHSAMQLVQVCGPDLALEIVANTNVDAVLLDRDMAVKNEDTGTARERHRPVTLKVMDESAEAMITRLFREATGKSGKGRRMADRFLARTRTYDLPADLTDAAGGDWQDPAFMQRAITEVIREFAPSYALPSSLDVALARQEDGSFTFKADLDWSALRAEYSTRPGADELTVGHLLVGIVDMREDLHLAAAFGAGVAQDPLGARLLRAKCADLTAALTSQQARIDQFQEIVVHGLTDLRGAINTGACSFGEFLRVLGDAEEFRDWLDTQTPDADLVKSYFAEVTKKRVLNSQVVRELRWLIPAAAGFALFLPDAVLVAPSVAAALAAADRFVISRFSEGWRPAIFVDSKLRPAVNR